MAISRPLCTNDMAIEVTAVFGFCETGRSQSGAGCTEYLDTVALSKDGDTFGL